MSQGVTPSPLGAQPIGEAARVLDDVVSASDPKEGTYAKTTQCIIVFVAIDEQGGTAEVDHWQPETDEDVALEEYAKRMMELRKSIEARAAGLREAMPS